MIRIKTIHIEEFRGIRSLALLLDAKNFGICGPNGTGKSGVVDAIEFCVTGDVTRLSGQGTAGLTVKTHAPHVDQKNHPEKANVTITADIPALNKTVTIHRSVKNPQKVDFSPDDADVKGVIEVLESHPEFALSRREIVKYIITPPGERAKDVQTLLRLDHVENLRKVLGAFNNASKKEAVEADRARVKAESDLINALQADSYDASNVLEKVNEKRELLGLEQIKELTAATSFKIGVSGAGDRLAKPVLRKAVALNDISALQTEITNGEPPGHAETRQSAAETLEQLKDDENALMLARRYGLLKTGLDLVSEDACPLCGTEWNAEELREYLRGKMLSAAAIEQSLEKLHDNINAILQAISERIQAVEKTVEYCKSLKPPLKQDKLIAYIEQLEKVQTALSSFLKDHSEIVPALQAISVSWWSPEPGQQAQIDECKIALDALPETSAEDDAREILIVAQERYERLQEASAVAEHKKANSVVAQKVLDHYNASSTEVLEAIYDKVADDFSRYYRMINRDEQALVCKLSPEPAKLILDVDFYGRGLFPPGAYHSEGHQDAMGLCLYLALMKHTLGDNFTFAVLDDVLMSVDAGHRREVCRLLKSEFPDTQFILTTHDRVWLQYMKTEGIIAQSQSFGGWTVDTGPQVWDDTDIWTEIKNSLDADDVPRAAWLLRRYLEHTAIILADNLRASVQFKSDGHYDLGDLLPPALKEWQKRLETGEKSARRWGLDEKRQALEAKRSEAKDLIKQTNAEQWVINPSVHFNEWANLQCDEFRDVADIFKKLLESMRCETCQSYLYVLPRRGTAEEIRCSCGATTINLKLED